MNQIERALKLCMFPPVMVLTVHRQFDPCLSEVQRNLCFIGAQIILKTNADKFFCYQFLAAFICFCSTLC